MSETSLHHCVSEIKVIKVNWTYSVLKDSIIVVRKKMLGLQHTSSS